MAELNRICANCGQPEGKHARVGDSCPEGDWYSKTSTFHLSAEDIRKLTAHFLDQIADCFDAGMAIYTGTPFLNPDDGAPISAQALFERIRLGK